MWRWVACYTEGKGAQEADIAIFKVQLSSPEPGSGLVILAPLSYMYDTFPMSWPSQDLIHRTRLATYLVDQKRNVSRSHGLLAGV